MKHASHQIGRKYQLMPTKVQRTVNRHIVQVM